MVDIYFAENDSEKCFNGRHLFRSIEERDDVEIGLIKSLITCLCRQGAQQVIWREGNA